MSTPANTEVILREGTAADLPFIASTWRESFGRSKTRWALGDHYFKVWPGIIDLLLSRSKVLIAADPEDTLIAGWAVYQPLLRTLHYVYVRGRTATSPGLQGAGVATALLERVMEGRDLDAWTITHETKNGSEILSHWMALGRPWPRSIPIINEEAIR